MLTSLAPHLRQRQPADATRHGLVAEIEHIAEARSALDAYEHRVVVAIEALRDQGLNAAEVLRSVGRVSSRAASRVASTAKRMSELPATAESLAAGRISAEHANVIADAARRVDPALVDTELAPMASRESADLFARHAREWVTGQQEEVDIARRHARQQKLRSVKRWVDDDGMRVWLARIDPVAAKELESVLDAEYDRLWRADGGRDMRPTDPGWRSPEQRMAEAFTNLITQQGSDTATATHVRHQMLSIVDLNRMRTDQPEGRADLTDGTPLPQSVLERLACISDISGVIFDGPGKPIWIGRTHRTASTAQWKGLIARDGGCIGCGADPNRCEAHHIDPWNRGGLTDITNLVLVCSRCHHNIHDRGMRLIRRPNGGWTIGPRDRASPESKAA